MSSSQTIRQNRSPALELRMEMTVALTVVLILDDTIVVPSAVLDAIAHIPLHQPDRRHRRERRSGRTVEQHIKSVEMSMEVTKGPAARRALQARMDHLQERVRKFFRERRLIGVTPTGQSSVRACGEFRPPKPKPELRVQSLPV